MIQQNERSEMGKAQQEEVAETERKLCHTGQDSDQTRKPKKQKRMYQLLRLQSQPGIRERNEQPQENQRKDQFLSQLQVQHQGGEPEVQLYIHPTQQPQFPSQSKCEVQNINQEDNQTELNRRLLYETEHDKNVKYQIPHPEEIYDQNQTTEEFESKYLEYLTSRMQESDDHPIHKVQAQGLLEHQSGVNPQMYQVVQHMQQELRFPEVTDIHNQQLNQAAQISSRSRDLILLEGDPNETVLCPMGKLPEAPCRWVGKRSWREMHVVMSHSMNLYYSNRYTTMSFKSAAILNAYTEYFLCYTIPRNDPNKLYCVVQHACQTHNCMLTYQYRCEIRAANGYEKITDTRLVGHFADNFTTLTKLGKCVRFDADVVYYFAAGNDELNVDFTILIPEPI
jgi:hypothetical protein